MLHVKQVDPKNDNTPAWDTWVPAWTNPTTPYNINENVAVGTSVVRVSATDADKGAQDGVIEYSIVSTTGSGEWFILLAVHWVHLNLILIVVEHYKQMEIIKVDTDLPNHYRLTSNATDFELLWQTS